MIATGSTARVDLCRSLGPRQAGQLIAVKRLLPDLLSDEGIGKRFLDEVWMTAALRDSNVVTVVGWGQDEHGPYLASELVQGVSLARLSKSVIDTGEEFPERLVVYICLSVARGLAAAHELRSDRGELLSLVHRDISAQNVLVGFQGEVKVTDFGLAKAKDRLTVTTSELPARSMGHVSPEELSQKPVDHRSDIFGFGVMMFELATNKAPFSGKDEIAVLEAVLKHPAPDPQRLRPKIDRALAALMLRCLEKDPARRPQSAREIAHALEEWLYVHGYLKDSQESLARFVRRNSMRQMRWFENVIAQRALAAPVPAPPVPPQPSLYLGHEGGEPMPAATGASGATGGSRTVRRDNEPTAVVGRRLIAQNDPVRKGRPEAPGSNRLRRRESTSGLPRTFASDSGETHKPYPAEPSTDGDDEFEDVPTVALKFDPKYRAELRDLAAQKRQAAQDAARAPLETVRIEDPETNRESTLSELAGGFGALAHPSPRDAAMRIDAELASLRKLAAERHERARVAREAARRAALEADEAESSARAAERAIGGARSALELVSRGDPSGALKRLEEVLATSGLKR
ncbi:MAG: serine/threonine protein kinase [Polyangiaceae bacterium]|nr:serine/threonine protein kinase [Polyangiaceae bacterium]